MDIVSVLESAGFGFVEHVATLAEALKQVRERSWNVVVADANLNGRSIEPVIALLHEKAVPFLILTGYERHSLPAIIGDAPVITKPFSPDQLAAAVRMLGALS